MDIINNQKEFWKNVVFQSREDENSIEHMDIGYKEFFQQKNKDISQLLQALIEREEQQIENYRYEQGMTSDWDRAKQDTITNLKSLQANLQTND